MNEKNHIENYHIENYHEYYLTFTKKAAEAKCAEIEKDLTIDNYYFIGVSIDGEKRNLTFDEFRSAIFTDTTAMVAEVERLISDKRDLADIIADFVAKNSNLEKENERLRASLHNRDVSLETYRIEVEQLNLQLAQAKAAISIVDPATGTGAFLGNPPFGEKGGEG